MDRTQARVEALISARVGMRIDGAVGARVQNGLIELAASRKVGLHDYVDLASANAEVFQELLDRVTVQETSFFRDDPQFRLLARLLPPYGSTGSIWSAACSNGQEAYSIAMVLKEQGFLDWRVIASDISTKAVARTRTGFYEDREMTGVCVDRKRRFFRRIRSGWEIDPEIRGVVDVSAHSLVKEALPFADRTCPIVFCRNVLIYLKQGETQSLMLRLSRAMPTGGYLFLGQSESLWHMDDLFEVETLDGCFVYKRPSDSTDSVKCEPLANRHVSSVRVPGPVVTAPEAAPLLPQVVEDAIEAGRMDEAVRLGRQVVFRSPDDPVSHWILGLSLEHAGDARAARRSFSAARAAIHRSSSKEFGHALEGYSLDAFIDLLDIKSGTVG
jgi:chemotaxis methyl-accepting protein methylase